MDTHLPITDDQLRAVLAAANVERLPPVPGRPTIPGNYLMYLIFALIVFGVSFKQWRKA